MLNAIKEFARSGATVSLRGTGRLVMLLLGVATLPGASAEMLWRIGGEKAQGYLVGSIHFGRADMYPLSAAVEQAFQRAQTLVVEIDIVAADSLQASTLVDRLGRFTGDARLQAHLPPAVWESLVKHTQGLGIPVTAFEHQRAWLVAITLTNIELQKRGYSEQFGVDRYFLEQAGRRREIVELESMESQLSVFSSMTDAEQALFLSRTIADLDRSDGYFLELLSAWENGDAKGMDRLIRQGFDGAPEYGRLFQGLFTDRNRTMVEKMGTMLDDGREHFFVLGAGHMVGSGGIVELLRGRGYIVERVGLGS